MQQKQIVETSLRTEISRRDLIEAEWHSEFGKRSVISELAHGVQFQSQQVRYSPDESLLKVMDVHTENHGFYTQQNDVFHRSWSCVAPRHRLTG